MKVGGRGGVCGVTGVGVRRVGCLWVRCKCWGTLFIICRWLQSHKLGTGGQVYAPLLLSAPHSPSHRHSLGWWWPLAGFSVQGCWSWELTDICYREQVWEAWGREWNWKLWLIACSLSLSLFPPPLSLSPPHPSQPLYFLGCPEAGHKLRQISDVQPCFCPLITHCSLVCLITLDVVR